MSSQVDFLPDLAKLICAVSYSLSVPIGFRIAASGNGIELLPLPRNGARPPAMRLCPSHEFQGAVLVYQALPENRHQAMQRYTCRPNT